MAKVLVLSSSSLHTFLECRKSYDLTWHRGLEPRHDNQAIIKGQSFHDHAAIFADCLHAGDPKRWNEYKAQCLDNNDEMFAVFQFYREHKWQAKPDQISFSSAAGTRWEHPLYLPLVKTGGYDVWIRFTIDFLWRDEAGWLQPEDYKTFSQAPSETNSDLDFQARGIIEMVRRYYGEDRVQFTFKHVRSVPPGYPRGTGPWTYDAETKEWFKIKELQKGPKREVADVWKPEECYFDGPVVSSKTEGDVVWAEMQDAAKDLVRCMKEGRWYRSSRRGTMPYTCHTCLSKHLCRADIQLGRLDEQTIEQYAVPRPALVVPDEDWLRFRKRLPKKLEAVA